MIIVLQSSGKIAVNDNGTVKIADTSPLPSGCCCGGTPCDRCDGTVGSAQIEITGYSSSGACDQCERINGTWILPRISDSASCCIWQLCHFADIDDGTGFAGAFCNFETITMRLCLNGSVYEHDILIQTTNVDNCGGDQNGGISVRNLGATKPSCSDMEGTFSGVASLYCSSVGSTFTVTML